MRSYLPRLSGRWTGIVGVLLLFASAEARAGYDVYGRQAETIYLPGGFVDLADPAFTPPKDYVADYMGLIQYYSYAAVYDTGSSGNIISAFEADNRSLPTTGGTYSDIGIGGTEMFNVSKSTTLKLAPVTVGVDGSEVLNNYSSYGNYKFQIRQADPLDDFGFPITVNIVGTPVLNQHVMHVLPNAASFPWDDPSINYLQTTLIPSAPVNLGAAPSQLVLVPSDGTAALHVPLSYQNFITGSAPVSTSTNPTVPGVQVIDHREAGPSPVTSNWLFDTGASVSMIGRNMAAAVGIDLDHELPITTVDVMGIGSSGTLTFDGYQLDEIAVPLAGGGQMTFHDITVFVPNAGALPADLPGIFGMNLISKSFSGQDQTTGDLLNLTNSAFNDWYVVPPSMLPGDANGDGRVDINDLNAILLNYGRTGMTLANGDFNGDGRVDINDLNVLLANYGATSGPAGMGAVPEPTTLVMLAAAAAGLLAVIRRSRGTTRL